MMEQSMGHGASIAKPKLHGVGIIRTANREKAKERMAKVAAAKERSMMPLTTHSQEMTNGILMDRRQQPLTMIIDDSR